MPTVSWQAYFEPTHVLGGPLSGGTHVSRARGWGSCLMRGGGGSNSKGFFCTECFCNGFIVLFGKYRNI